MKKTYPKEPVTAVGVMINWPPGPYPMHAPNCQGTLVPKWANGSLSIIWKCAHCGAKV